METLRNFLTYFSKILQKNFVFHLNVHDIALSFSNMLHKEW
jgi:hypothetical protein